MQTWRDPSADAKSPKPLDGRRQPLVTQQMSPPRRSMAD